jgi:hypothetical protein
VAKNKIKVCGGNTGFAILTENVEVVFRKIELLPIMKGDVAGWKSLYY